MKVNKYLLLHFIILLWGFTPVLGKLITLDAYDLVWYRLLFAGLSLAAWLLLTRVSFKVSGRNLLTFLSTGVVVGLHWFFFYHAIKVSNVAVALAGFATVTLFASLFQPLLLNKKFYWTDLVYGLSIGIGLLVILNFEQFYFWGVFYGVMSAITGAFFSVYNGKLIDRAEAGVIAIYEFAGAFIFISLFKWFGSGADVFVHTPGAANLFWLLVLSIFCTTLAFTLSIKILKHFTPLTVIVTNNLEPIYGIVFSLLLFGESEYMSQGFYAGALIILVSVFTYPFISEKLKREKSEAG
jgi:drug/metabolite transporter (DMT)-like permease